MAQPKSAPKKSPKAAAKAAPKPPAKKAAAASATVAKKARAAAVPKGAAAKPNRGEAEQELKIDRRRANERRGDSPEAPVAVAEVKPALERREKVNRRRQIDPTTCERDYSDQELEFMNALDAYKRRSGRMFPTCSEVLEVIREIGYVRVSAAELAALRSMAAPGDDLEAAATIGAVEAFEESDALRLV